MSDLRNEFHRKTNRAQDVLKLAEEIRIQSKEDILSSGWMVRIAQRQNADELQAAHLNAVFEAIALLRAQDEIV